MVGYKNSGKLEGGITETSHVFFAPDHVYRRQAVDGGPMCRSIIVGRRSTKRRSTVGQVLVSCFRSASFHKLSQFVVKLRRPNGWKCSLHCTHIEQLTTLIGDRTQCSEQRGTRAFDATEKFFTTLFGNSYSKASCDCYVPCEPLQQNCVCSLLFIVLKLPLFALRFRHLLQYTNQRLPAYANICQIPNICVLFPGSKGVFLSSRFHIGLRKCGNNPANRSILSSETNLPNLNSPVSEVSPTLRPLSFPSIFGIDFRLQLEAQCFSEFFCQSPIVTSGHLGDTRQPRHRNG